MKALTELCSGKHNLRLGIAKEVCFNLDCNIPYSVESMREILDYAMRKFKLTVIVELSILFDQLPSSCKTKIMWVPIPDLLTGWSWLCLNRTLDLVYFTVQVPLGTTKWGDLAAYPCLVSHKLSERDYFLAIGPRSVQHHLDPFILFKPFGPLAWACVFAAWFLARLKVLNRAWLPAQLTGLILIIYSNNLKALVAGTDIVKPIFDGSISGLIQALKTGALHIPKVNFEVGTKYFFLGSVPSETLATVTRQIDGQVSLYPEELPYQEKNRIVCQAFMSKRGVALFVEKSAETNFWNSVNCLEGEIVRTQLELQLPALPSFFIFPKNAVGRALRDFTDSVSEVIVGLKDKKLQAWEVQQENYRRDMLGLGQKQRKDILRTRHFIPGIVVLLSGLIISTFALFLEVFMSQ